MRILFCNYEYPPLGGGGGVATALLAEELTNRHEVSVLTSECPGLSTESRVNGVHVMRVPLRVQRRKETANLASMFAYMVQGKRARWRLSDVDFDLINTHFVLPSGPVGDALARFFRRPNVLSVHGGDLYDPSKWLSPHRHALLRLWVRHLLRRADHVVGQSTDTLANIHRFYERELAVTKIPLGIPPPPTSVGNRSAYGFAGGDLLLITVGRLISRKAVDQLFELLAELPARTQLLILGSGPRQAELHRHAARCGVQRRVWFLGFVPEDEKFRLLGMADMFVSTSQHEGFGLAFLEAMACGLPVVCYDHGGQNEFLESGVTGHVVRLNNRAEFVRAVAALAGDVSARRRMGAHNRKRVEKYHIEYCARQYERVFEQVIKGSGRGCIRSWSGSAEAPLN